MTVHTESELLFERACNEVGVVWERIPEDITRTPDYNLSIGGRAVFAEVKQLDNSPDDEKALEEFRKKGSGAFFGTADDRVRRAIKDANNQLKQKTIYQFSGVLVLFANTIIGDYDPQDIHDAMFGSETYTIEYPLHGPGDGRLVDVSLGLDGKMKPERHTSTSAVVSLRCNGNGDPSMTFYHNKFAKVPFDPDWLRAESVRHYASKDRDGMAIPGWVEV